MGNRWQFMFAVGEVLTLAVIAVFLAVDMNHELVWRVTLAFGAAPALVILIMRHDLPEPRYGSSDRAASARQRRSPEKCTATRSTCCPIRTSRFRSLARPPSSPT